MDDKAAATADALEILHMNQTALRAAIEEVSTWIRQRGSVNAHDSTMVSLQALDTNADAITSAIERLRSYSATPVFSSLLIFHFFRLGTAAGTGMALKLGTPFFGMPDPIGKL